MYIYKIYIRIFKDKYRRLLGRLNDDMQTFSKALPRPRS